MDDNDLKRIYRQKKSVKKFTTTTLDQFKNWYSKDAFEKGCAYCGLKNEESFLLYQKRHHATRGGRRARRLELDRKNPKDSYDNLANLVWCCYWCNNTKSNFFSEDEFKPIAREIGNALRSLL